MSMLRFRFSPAHWAGAGAMLIVALITTAALAERAAGERPQNTDREVLADALVGKMTGQQCVDCHAVDAGYSHPVNRALMATMQAPAELPLHNGRITCVTCHLDTADAHQQARLTAGSMLRVEPKALCTECHSTVAKFNRASMHPLGVGKAHLRWSKRAAGAGKLKQPAKASGMNAAFAGALAVDDGSRACMSCHDGTTASDSISMSASQINFSAGHRSGIAYKGSAGAGLKNALTLDPRVQLFNGQVACQSCHSPYSTERGLLVMSNRDSALCLTCHDPR